MTLRGIRQASWSSFCWDFDGNQSIFLIIDLITIFIGYSPIKGDDWVALSESCNNKLILIYQLPVEMVVVVISKDIEELLLNNIPLDLLWLPEQNWFGFDL